MDNRLCFLLPISLLASLLRQLFSSNLRTPDVCEQHVAPAPPNVVQEKDTSGDLEESFILMEHKIDRISELPELVLEHILSLIPLKQVFQLSILSKRWQNVWTLLPVPEFNQHSQEFSPYFYANKLGKISDNEKKQKIRRKRDEFKYFVERILQSRYRQRLSINKFKLRMIFDEPNCAIVNRCIGYAIKSNVKEFYLEVSPFDLACYRYDHLFSKGILRHLSKNKYYYSLPLSVLTAKSITKLTLDSCKLDSFYSDINLSSLKMLALDGVCVEDQYCIQSIIEGCPVVEDISIKNCHGFKSIHVSGRPKLMALELIRNHDLERIEVQASTLQSLCFSYHEEYTLCQIKLAPCENLKKLELYAPNITDKWLHDVLRKHPLLEILDLSSCNTLERVYISSHRMKTLELSLCENLIEVNIDTPNLHKLGYYGGVISFSLNAMALSEANIRFSKETDPWHVEEIEFLAKLRHPKLLTWKVYSVESVIFSKELREIQPSPLDNVKKLELKAYYWPKSFEINELIDTLLWISPLLDILFIESKDENSSIDHSILFKFSYENPACKGENPNCCKLLQDPCWRHGLKAIKIEDFSRSVDKKTLEKYFFDNAEILDSFQYDTNLSSESESESELDSDSESKSESKSESESEEKA